MPLGQSVRTLDRACYDRSFHTLSLKRLHYLRSHDQETEMDSCASNVIDLEAELDASTKICDLEVANWDLVDSRESIVKFLQSA